MYIYVSFRAGDPVEVLTDQGSTPDSVSTGWQADRAGRVRDPGGWSTHCSGTLERVGREVPAAPVALMMGKWQRGSSTRPVKAQQSPPPPDNAHVTHYYYYYYCDYYYLLFVIITTTTTTTTSHHRGRGLFTQRSQLGVSSGADFGSLWGVSLPWLYLDFIRRK